MTEFDYPLGTPEAPSIGGVPWNGSVYIDPPPGLSPERELMWRILFDIRWVLANLITILDKSANRPVKFVPNRPQDWVLFNYYDQLAQGEPNRQVDLKGRQFGFSTLWTCMLFVFTALRGQNSFILAHLEAPGKSIFDKAENALKTLPSFTHNTYEYVRDADGYIVLDANDDPVLALDDVGNPIVVDTQTISLVEPPTNVQSRTLMAWVSKTLSGRLRRDSAENIDAGVGETYQNLQCTEVPLFRNAAHTIGKLLPAIPKTPGSCIAYEFTARNEGDYAHNLWLRAAQGKGMNRAVFSAWYWHLDYGRKWRANDEPFSPEEEDYRDIVAAKGHEYPLGPDGRLIPRLQLVHAEKGRVDLSDIAVGFRLTDEQLLFRRDAIEDANGDMVQWRSEYPYCIAGDQRVGTEAGLVPISEVVSRKLATCSKGVITGWHPKPAANLVRIETEDGYSVRCTEDHRISTPSGWVEARNLQGGDEVVLQRPRLAKRNYAAPVVYNPSCTAHLEITPEWGRLLGYYMSDGSFSGAVLSFACDAQDRDVIEDIRGLVKRLLGLDVCERVVGTKGGGIEIRVGAEHTLKPIMEQLGLAKRHYLDSPNGGQMIRTVCVPDCIWRSPEPVVREFLRGLFEGDGFNSWKSSTIGLFSKREDFLRDVQQLLLACGVMSRLCVKDKVNSFGRVYVGRELTLRGLRCVEFYERIGFFGSRKRANEWKPKRRLDSRMKRNDFIGVIKSVELDGCEPVFDITVAGEECFDAGGILVHNCPEEAFAVAGRKLVPPNVMDLMDVAARDPLKNKEGRFDPGIGEYKAFMGAGGKARAQWRASRQGRVHRFELPRPNATYIVWADPSSGAGVDPAGCGVDRVEFGKTTTVCSFEGFERPHKLARILARMGRHYRDDAVLDPATGKIKPGSGRPCRIGLERNTFGQAVIHELDNLKYKRICRFTEKVKADYKPGQDRGFPTQKDTKMPMLQEFVAGCYDGQVVVPCRRTLGSIRGMQYLDDDDKLVGAPRGMHDDLAMGRAISFHFAKQFRAFRVKPVEPEHPGLRGRLARGFPRAG